jgi:hypothetical protein
MLYPSATRRQGLSRGFTHTKLDHNHGYKSVLHTCLLSRARGWAISWYTFENEVRVRLTIARTNSATNCKKEKELPPALSQKFTAALSLYIYHDDVVRASLQSRHATRALRPFIGTYFYTSACRRRYAPEFTEDSFFATCSPDPPHCVFITASQPTTSSISFCQGSIALSSEPSILQPAHAW